MSTVCKADVWSVVEAALSVARTMLLYGPPGTGKSYAAHQSGLNGRPLYTVTLTQDTAAAELRGHLWPVANKGKGGGTTFEWRDGPALTAWREGGRLVVNEINHAGGDCLSFLLNLLDTEGTAMMTLPTGETLRPHPDFQCIATMNGQPEDLGEALRDRFPMGCEIIEPNPNGIAALPDDLQDAARGTVCANDAERRITLRSWLAFAKYREVLGWEQAAFMVFGARSTDILNSLRIAK